MEATNKILPAYPAAVVIQGSAMLSSDPLRCQTGAGKVQGALKCLQNFATFQISLIQNTMRNVEERGELNFRFYFVIGATRKYFYKFVRWDTVQRA